MPHESMTPRERWLAVLRRQTPDRVPMDYWATLEASASLMQHLGWEGFPFRDLHGHLFYLLAG